MDEELNLDLDNIEQDAARKLDIKNRYQKLSEKVITTSKERDEANAKVQTSEQGRLAAEKQVEFYKGFSQISSKHPEAINFQDQILERVNRGYDPEEAALAILAKEGKLTNQTQPVVVQPITDVAGGSSPTIIPGNKSLNDMNSDEKFGMLSKLSNEEIAKALRN